jgi:hypothetical protein
MDRITRGRRVAVLSRTALYPPRSYWLCLSIVYSLCGCSDSAPPPIQTLPGQVRRDAPPKDEVKDMPTADETAEAKLRLDRAIAAHGGPVRLAKLRRQIQQQKGTLMTGRFGLVSSDMELKLDLPDRLRFHVKAQTPEGLYPISIGFDRGQAWMTENSVTRDVPPEVTQSLKAELNYRRLLTLMPLAEGELPIRPIEGHPFDQKPTRGIRVLVKGGPPLDLFFDVESHLLVRTLGWFLEGGVLQLREVQFRDFQDVDGLRLPKHVVDIRDGSPWVDCTVSYTLPNTIEDSEFKRPP